MTSQNISTRIGGTICGSSTAPSLVLLTNDTFLEEVSLMLAQENESVKISVQVVDGKMSMNMK